MPDLARLAPDIAAVHVDLHQLVSVSLYALATQPHLIIDRGSALEVGTKPGMCRCLARQGQ
jgi:hypothetical protein